MSTPARPKSTTTLRRLALQARPYWPHLGALMALSLLAVPLSLLNPVPFKLIVDSVLGDHELPGIVQRILPAGTERTSAVAAGIVAGLMVAIALLKQLLDMGYAVLRTWTTEKLVLGFRTSMFRHSQRLSLAYHDTKGSGEVTYRIQYDAPAIQWIMVDALIPLATSIFTLVSMVVVLTRIDWQLALIAMVVAPALYASSTFFSKRLKAHWREAKHHETSAYSVVTEVMGAVRVVKAFAAEDREQERFEARARRSFREQLRVSIVSSRFALAVGLTMAAGTAVVLYVGTRHVQAGLITLGDLVLVMSYLPMLYAPLETLTRSAGSLQGSFVSAERAFELLDEEPEVKEAEHPKNIGRARGAVVFENVSFAYRPDRPAISDVSFDIPAGAHVGIAGHTGAGKSTIISLLLRLYDPSVGRILLDGVDLRDLALKDLRNQYAIVLQEPVLFSASIGENIAYARPGATQAQIEAAARAANAHDFISKLEKGYDTEVGERGLQLSGGERQRISLARAFLKDAPILILDEPTSSVDVKTEALIIEGLERLMKGRTSFMIAHRLSTLDLCDVRLEINGGQLTSFTSKRTP
ncbi:MAG: ABC transporter ATP-binding protein [Opitutaceae bacterium]|nr:ABC transporter ATP-binding protein [Opitutaceae bacterium]